MKPISIILCMLLLFPFVLISQETSVSNTDGKPKIAVIRVENGYNNTSYETVCDTVTDTVEFTLKLMDRYRIERTDYIDPYSRFEAARQFFNNYNFDNAVFGRVFPDPDGDIVLAMSVYDRAADMITIEKQVEVGSLMDVFDGSDQLTAAVVEAFSGTHIGFGTIIFKAEGDVGDVVVYVDGERAGMNPSRLTILQGERTVEIRLLLPEGEKMLKRETVNVEENRELAVNYTVEEEQEEVAAAVIPEQEELATFARAFFDDELSIHMGSKIFFPNVLHDYTDFFLHLEGLPTISDNLQSSIDDYERKIRLGKIGLFAGLGLFGASIVPLYLGITALALGTIGEIDIDETFGLVLTIGGGSAALLGLAGAGISAIIVFTAIPEETVDSYNSEFGY